LGHVEFGSPEEHNGHQRSRPVPPGFPLSAPSCLHQAALRGVGPEFDSPDPMAAAGLRPMPPSVSPAGVTAWPAGLRRRWHAVLVADLVKLEGKLGAVSAHILLGRRPIGSGSRLPCRCAHRQRLGSPFPPDYPISFQVTFSIHVPNPFRRRQGCAPKALCNSESTGWPVTRPMSLQVRGPVLLHQGASARSTYRSTDLWRTWLKRKLISVSAGQSAYGGA
jgi:hypothetical protein